MRNQYVGDVGDFGKYGLLRWLCVMTGDEPDPERALKLGVVWYFNMDDQEKKDGRAFEYANLINCDPWLYLKLRYLTTSKQRTVDAVRQAKILPQDTANYANLIGNKRDRKSWLLDALNKTVGADLVFVDPDKGIASENQQASHSKEHAFMDELKPFIERGQSLIIYQHAAHASREMQIMYLILRLQWELGLTWIRTLRFHHGDRFFFIVVQPKHKDIINKRLASFRESLWCTTSSKVFTLHDEPWPSISLPCKP